MFALALAAAIQLAAQPATAAQQVRPGGSAEVRFAFPTSIDGVSVGRAGEAALSLRIPTPAAYLEPDLAAVYSSRGGDGPLGMGWSIPIAHVSLDLSNGFAALATTPDANIITTNGKRYLTDRFIAAPGGSLVCEPRPGRTGRTWQDDDCFTDPRGPIRFTPEGKTDVLSWRASDPLEGVTEEFGTSAASRVNAGDKTVTWLIARAVTRDGKEVRHFYEERRGSDERVRTAVLLGGNKVVRFLYAPRDTNRLSNYRWGTKRTTESLLTEIRLLDGCVPVQHDSDPDDVWTDFSSCDGARVIEKVVLRYGTPNQRYTGRYVLESWQHQSGDGSVAYGPVRFQYNGDDNRARTTGIGVVTEESASFPMPAGSTLVSSAGHAPFQNYVDWNRDGVADWVDAKNDTNAVWPRPTADHRIFVSLRNASGGFDTRKSYRDPLARYAGWIWDDGVTLESHQDASDRRGLPHQLPTSRTAAPAQLRAVFPEATIGINSAPWLYRTPGKDDTTTYMPIIEGLSMTVKCTKLGTSICGAIKDTYRTLWNGDLETFDYVGVKLADLQDLDGDGYLDRVVSGLLVVWDPSAPDADANGWRNPATGKPAIYVARFDPARDDFRPFVRYAIAAPSGDYAKLSPAFLSALAVEVNHNQEPGAADMSNHGGPISGITVAALGLDFLSALRQFTDHHASAHSPNDSLAPGAATNADDGPAKIGTNLNGALAAGEVVLDVANLAAETAGASPGVQQGLRTASAVYGMGHSSYSLARMAVGGVAANGQIASSALSPTAASVVGWASFTNAAVGVVATATNLIVVANAKKHMESVGFNAGAVAANAKTTVSVVSLSAASVSALATGIGIGFAIAAGGFATAWTGVGLVVGFVGALIGIGAAIGALLSPEGSIEYSAGKIKYDFYSQRGQVWRDKDVNSHTGSVRVLSGWADLDGDARPDLIVGKHRSDAVGFAVATGDVDDGETAPATAPWQTWSFTSASAPTELWKVSSKFYFQPDDVQRGDLIEVERGLGDLNGDGLLDVVDASADSPYGISAYLNAGRGFAAKTTFAVDAASAPASCNQPLRLSRGRSLSWTESVDKKTGYMVGLSNTIQMLGPDLDGNGLPDLVMKDERSYDSIANGGACVKSSGAAMCSATMPTDPEPEKGNEPCVAAKDVWFAEFDGWDKQDGTDEGRSHLTPAAFAVHSPSMLGDTYVAYNTGTGFLPFVKLDRKLPSLGGGLSVISTVNAVDDTPTQAVTGQSHFLADPDASGRLHLVGIDITEKQVWNPTGSHPVSQRYVFGIANPDALTQITYPDGGVANLTYRVQKAIQGEQGPPLWVLAGVSYDDGARASLQQLEGWSGGRPSVTYHYADAKLVGREFRGFAAIAEERFTGTDITQVIQTFVQDGPTRGATACTEVRGAAIDVATKLSAIPEHGTCEVTRGPVLVGTTPIDPDVVGAHTPVKSVAPQREAREIRTVRVSQESAATRIASVDVDSPLPAGQLPGRSHDFDDDTGQVTSCFPGAERRLGLPSLYPLQRRVENDYRAPATVTRTLADGSVADVLRDFDLTSATTSVYNGAGRASWSKLAIDYDVSPWKTPRSSTVTTSDGIRRKTDTKWRHERDDWAFLRAEQRELETSGAARLTTKFLYDAAAPYHPRVVTERAGGQIRKREYLAYDAGGLPTQIRDATGTTTYTYVPDGSCGTGKVATSTHSTDGYQATAGTEAWTYDCMGRTVRYVNAAGAAWTTTYDDLGVIKREHPAGRAPIEYEHAVGTIDAKRDSATLGAAPRTTRIETSEGEQRRTTIWWDGFFREYRRGTSVAGTRYLDLDFDGDGTPDRAHVGFADDARWFGSKQAQWLLSDRLLSAVGQVQCASTTYLDGKAPAAYASTLFDPLRRETLSRQFDGFEVRTRFGVDAQGRQTTHVENQLGEYHVRVADSLGRPVSDDVGGLSTIKYRYGAWGDWTRRTDGENGVELAERNGWGEVVKQCRQVGGPAPSTDLCPAGWPTETTRYDSGGRVIAITDPRGATTKRVPSVCGQPGRVELPAATSGDATTVGVTETRFDEACRPSEVRDPTGTVTKTHYEPGGQVMRIVAAAGTPDETTTRYGYDDLGRLLFREDGLRRRSYRVLDFRDQPIYEYRPDGARDATSYGVRGFVTATTSAAGETRAFAADLMGHVTRVAWSADVCGAVTPTTAPTTRKAVTRTFGYDLKGRMIDSWDELGARSHLDYDMLDRVTRSYAPSLTTAGAYDATSYTETGYDRAGRVTTTRDRAGHVTTRAYDRGGRLTSVSSTASGHRIEERYEYDLAGNLVKLLPADAQAAPADRCTVGPTTKAAYARTFSYSPRGLREGLTAAADERGRHAVATVRYDASGAAIAATDLRGQTTTIQYDRLHRAIATTDPSGAVRRTQYDDAGQVVETRNAAGLTTTVRYDAAGRPIEVVPPTGAIAVAGYDDDGRPTFTATLVDASAKRWEAVRYSYGVGGDLRAHEQAAFVGAHPTAATLTSLATRQRCGDAAGQTLALRDANGAVSTLAYDARGRTTAVGLVPVYGAATWNQIQYRYDEDDQIVAVTAPMGGTSAPATLRWTTTYDGAHRATKASTPYAGDDSAWRYDDDGRLCQRTDVHGATVSRQVDFGYDPRGLITTRAGTGLAAEHFSYDDAGLLTAATDGTGAWAWRRDATGRVVAQDQTATRLGFTATTEFGYRADGRIERLTYPQVPGFTAGPRELRWTYDAATGRVATIVSDRGAVMNGLRFDGAGRVLDATLGNGAVASDRFDPMGRLEERRVRHGSADVWAARYRYDAIGNLLAVDDQLDDTFDFTFTYDERSRLRSEDATALGGTWTYAQNDQDRLDTATPPSGAAVRTHQYGPRGNLTAVAVGAATTSYHSDEFGNRVRDDVRATTYVYDALDRLTAATTAGATMTHGYSFDARRVDAGDHVAILGLGTRPLLDVTLDARGKPAKVEALIDTGRFTQRVDAASGDTVYTAGDHLGSPVVFMGAAPGAVRYAAYSASGRPLARPSSSSALVTSIGFQGSLASSGGLDLMLHRHYDPDTGEFLSADPLGLFGGHSAHGFAGGNPVRLTDPTGLADEPDTFTDLEENYSYTVYPGSVTLSQDLTPEGIIGTMDIEGTGPEGSAIAVQAWIPEPGVETESFTGPIIGLLMQHTAVGMLMGQAGKSFATNHPEAARSVSSFMHSDGVAVFEDASALVGVSSLTAGMAEGLEAGAAGTARAATPIGTSAGSQEVWIALDDGSIALESDLEAVLISDADGAVIEGWAAPTQMQLVVAEDGAVTEQLVTTKPYVDVYRFANRADVATLASRASRESDAIRLEIAEDMADPAYRQFRAEQHMRGGVDETAYYRASPFVSTASDVRAAARTTDPWLKRIIEGAPHPDWMHVERAPDIIRFRVPADRLIYPRATNTLSTAETEVLFWGDSMAPYYADAYPNWFGPNMSFP